MSEKPTMPQRLKLIEKIHQSVIHARRLYNQFQTRDHLELLNNLLLAQELIQDKEKEYNRQDVVELLNNLNKFPESIQTWIEDEINDIWLDEWDNGTSG